SAAVAFMGDADGGSPAPRNRIGIRTPVSTTELRHEARRTCEPMPAHAMRRRWALLSAHPERPRMLTSVLPDTAASPAAHWIADRECGCCWKDAYSAVPAGCRHRVV